MKAEILILYYSKTGHTRMLAEHLCWGIEKNPAVTGKCRTVPSISTQCEATEPSVPDHGPPYATLDDLANCDGLLLGSPAYFGNMAAPLKYFIDSTSGLWLSGAMVGKPAAVFTSTSSLHGGQETTLTNMMLPLLHHGMVIAGLPYTNTALISTRTGCSPYGVSHFETDGNTNLSEEEKNLCSAIGERMATLALKLKN